MEEIEKFERWLKTVCFQKPTPEAYELARCAWKQALRETEAASSVPFSGGLACASLESDETCGLSNEGCDAWQAWSWEDKEDKPNEYFCKLSEKERHKYNE